MTQKQGNNTDVKPGGKSMLFPETHPGLLAPEWAVPGQTSSPASSPADRPAGLSDCSSCHQLLLPVYHIMNVSHSTNPRAALLSWTHSSNCDYLSLHLQQHGLPILWLHLCFHWSPLSGGGLSRQRVRKLHEEQLVTFAEAPSVQQVRQNLRLRERRRFENGLWLLYFNFLWFLFYWRQKRCQRTHWNSEPSKQVLNWQWVFSLICK